MAAQARISAAELHRVIGNVLPFTDDGDRSHVLEAVRIHTDGQLLVATATDTRIVAEDRARLLEGTLPDRLLHRDDAAHLLRILGDYDDLVATVIEESDTALTVEVAADRFRVGTYKGGTSGYPNLSAVLRTGGLPFTETGIAFPAVDRDRLRRVAAAVPDPEPVMHLSCAGEGQPVQVHIGGTFRAAIMPAVTGVFRSVQ